MTIGNEFAAKLFDRANIAVTVSAITISIGSVTQGVQRHSVLDFLVGAIAILTQVSIFISLYKSEKRLRNNHGYSDTHAAFMREATKTSALVLVFMDFMLISIAISKRDFVSISSLIFAVCFQLFAIFYHTDARKTWIG